MSKLYVNGTDSSAVLSSITAELTRNKSINAVITLGAPIALIAIQAIPAAHSTTKLYTFDTNAAEIAKIKSGQVQWAVDQQPYLQGYLSVDSLWLYLTNANVIGGGQTVLTGPSFIDSSNIAQVAAYARAGHPLTDVRAGVTALRVAPRAEREVFMTQTAEAPVTPPPIRDERMGRKSLLARLLARPEAGALVGAIVIYVFFFIIAPPFRSAASFSSVLYVTSTYGLMATPVALLMIGGEFDLSAGVSVTSAALCASLFSYEFTTNAWVGVLVALGLALFIGFLNGWIVVKTGHPELPGHPGDLLHAAGAQHRADPDHHQPGGQPGHLHLAGLQLRAGGVLRQLHHRRGEHPDLGRSTGSSSSRSRPGSCCEPASATGSSPSAAPRRPPGRWACRWRR